jgi:hypothetical protein
MSNTHHSSIDSKPSANHDIPGAELQESARRVLEIVARITRGDLSFRISEDFDSAVGPDRALLANLDEMARRLRYIVGRLQRAADSIDTVVGEVLRETQAVSAGVIDEARSIEETSCSVSEINSSTHCGGPEPANTLQFEPIDVRFDSSDGHLNRRRISERR